MMGFAVFQLFLLMAPALGAYVFPDDFKRCALDDSINDCLLEAISDALPKLAEGIESPIKMKTEPVFSPYCEYHPDNQVFIYDEYFWNLNHFGFNSSKVLSVSTDIANLRLNFTTFTPEMVQVSHYKANGTVLYNGTREPEPVFGDGPVEKVLTNTTILHQIQLELVEKDGVEYLNVTSYDTSVTLDAITFDYHRLVDGYGEPALFARQYINSTAMYITLQQQKPVEKFLAGMFNTYAAPLLASIPYGQIHL